MNRFFSKLDLREIRIDPRSSRFPPGTDESGDATADQPHEAPGEAALDGPKSGEIASQPSQRAADVPTWVASDAPESTDHPATRCDHVDQSPAPSPDVEVSAGGPGDDVLKVSARSRPSAVAGAIAGVVRESGRAEVQAIGAGATNQAVKAVAIARDYLQETGIEVICLPAFIDVTIGDEDRTAIRLVIEPR